MQSDDDESSFAVFGHRRPQPLVMSDLELSDSDDSSGISSNEFNLDDLNIQPGKIQL